MIRLTREYALEAIRIGMARYNASADFASSRKFWQGDIMGAACEAAVEQATGHVWTRSVNDFTDTPDVGPYQVRGAHHHHYRLIIRPKDVVKLPKDALFLLVTTEDSLHHVIHGWLPMSECLRDEWQDDPVGRETAWFVPQDALRPLEAAA